MQRLDGIENVYIPLRIIVTENDDIKNEVTIATNSQTEVKPEQIEALSQFQKKLELYYQSMREPTHLFYERRSRQYHSDSLVKKTQIITIPIQIKTFAAAYLNVPHSVSGYYGTIVKKFGSQIFNSNHQMAPYFASALCYYKLEGFFRSGQIDKELKKLRFHLIMLAKIIKSGLDTNPQFNSREIERQALSLINELQDDTKALALFDKGAEICRGAGLDFQKRQFKSESETELLIRKAMDKP